MINAMCIGGPNDGKCVVLADGLDWFRCVIKLPMPSLDKITSKEMEFMQAEYVTYTRRELFGVTVWAPDSMREHDIIQLFYMRYFCGNTSETW